MKLGHSCMIGSSGLTIVDLARGLEERCFESLWLGEHGHMPVDSRIPIDHQGGGSDPDLIPPEPYRHMPDPVVSLSAAAVSTKRLRLGFGVMLLLERHPLVAAKELATLDHLSGGRIELGVGVGWNQRQLQHYSDIPWRRRYRALEETIEVLRRAWREEVIAFDGDFFAFQPFWMHPKPVQQGGIPVLFGGVGPLAISHAARWADGWLVADDRVRDVDVALEDFRRRVVDEGRTIDEVPITLNVRLLPDAGGELPNRERLLGYRDAGIDRVVLIDVSSDVMQPAQRWAALDEYAALIPELGS